MADQPKWRKFEDLVAHIQRTLSSNARVQQNISLLGRQSGVERQIDILVHTNIGQFSLDIVIDCKDYKEKVDVKDVEAFMGLVKDVGANKGALVAYKGFTKAAKNRAKNAGIDLYKMIDAISHEWQTYISIPVLIDDRSIKSFSLNISSINGFRLLPETYENPAKLVLYNNAGSRIGDVTNLINYRWNNDDISHEPGIHKVRLTEKETYMLADGVLYKVNVLADVKVARTLFFGRLRLEEIQGFKNEITGELITKGFTTASLNHEEVEKTWQRIESKDVLAVEPVILEEVSSYYPVEGINED